MTISTVNLSAGIVGQAYKQCITLNGKPKRLSMVSLPLGFTASLSGNVFCLESAKLPSAGSFAWTASIVSCRACEVLQLVGEVSITAVDACACTPMTPLAQPLVSLTAIEGESVDIVVPLTGSGPYEFCQDFQMPDCLMAKIIGDSVFVSGVAKKSGRITFAVKNTCGCECFEWSQKVVVAPVITPCVINWTLDKTSFDIDVEKTQTYTAIGLPPNCSITLGVYVGAVPLLIGGVQPQVTLTTAAPTASYPQTWPAIYAGQDLNIQPITLSSCGCSVQPQRINFTVKPAVAPTCSTVLTIFASTC